MIPLAVPLIAATARTVGTRMLGNGIKYAGNVIKNNPKISSGLGLAGLYGAIGGGSEGIEEKQRLTDISKNVANSGKNTLPIVKIGSAGGKVTDMAFDKNTGNYWVGNTPLNVKDGSLQRFINTNQLSDNSLEVDKPTKDRVVEKSSNYVSPYEAGQGRSKSEVLAIQKMLNAETGANLVEDSKWGLKTQAAYEAYANRNASKNSAQDTQNAQLPTEGLAVTVAPKEVGFWERLFQDDRTPEQKAAEQQAIVDKILGGDSGNTGLAAAQYGR